MKERNKPVLIQVINDLGAGGAERLLVGLLKDLSEHYDVVIVTLRERVDFAEKEIICKAHYVIGFRGLKDLIPAVKRFKQIIRKHQPALISSHLYWSTIVSRFACPKKVPLIFTVHQVLSEGAFYYNKKGILLKWLDKLTYRKRYIMIGVSGGVIEDYDREIGLKGESHVLHNYVEDRYFKFNTGSSRNEEGFRLVAVGNPKWEKNFEGLIRALSRLRDKNILCDIYGESPYNKRLEELILALKAPVTMKGRSENIHEKLKDYDAFIMSSFSEGFGIAAAEAMAAGLPVISSDLKVMREVTGGHAIFFDPQSEDDLVQKLTGVLEGHYDLEDLAARGKKIAVENYTKAAYLEKLLAIYKQAAEGRE